MATTKKSVTENKQLRKRLLKTAEKTNDLRLYKLANGEGDILDYLIRLVKDNGIGSLEVCGETLDSVLRANRARRRKLAGWLLLDNDETYREIHQKEIDVLDEYSVTMLTEIFAQMDDLKAKVAAQ